MSFLNEIKESKLQENSLGVHNTLTHGLLNVKEELSDSHPLEKQEKNYQKLNDEITMKQLRINQGLYAPFKFEMEREFTSKIGRLPCLRSSNLMASVIRGTDDTIQIEDVLNNQKEHCEYNRNYHD